MPLVASAIRGRGGFPNLPEEHMTVPTGGQRTWQTVKQSQRPKQGLWRHDQLASSHCIRCPRRGVEGATLVRVALRSTRPLDAGSSAIA
jgi:hypothetical protein